MISKIIDSYKRWHYKRWLKNEVKLSDEKIASVMAHQDRQLAKKAKVE